MHNALRLSGDRQGSRVGGDYRKQVRRAIRCLGSDSLLLWPGATGPLPPARDRLATGSGRKVVVPGQP
ncbi:hypothetical protein MDS_2962 [Ectopseudomonas mendocina NK-01]|nr:hypothetical protein MDS_2962 [Pseudomonas mendocina NK-01]